MQMTRSPSSFLGLISSSCCLLLFFHVKVGWAANADTRADNVVFAEGDVLTGGDDSLSFRLTGPLGCDIRSTSSGYKVGAFWSAERVLPTRGLEDTVVVACLGYKNSDHWRKFKDQSWVQRSIKGLTRMGKSNDLLLKTHLRHANGPGYAVFRPATCLDLCPPPPSAPDDQLTTSTQSGGLLSGLRGLLHRRSASSQADNPPVCTW